MEKKKTPADFREWTETFKTESIGEDIILFDDINQIPYFEHPTMLFDYTLTGIILQGKLELGINLKRHVFRAPCIMFCLDGQIIQYFNASSDCSGLFIVFSKHFTEKIQLNSQQLMPLFLYLKENPATSLEKEELSFLLDCYSLLHKTVNTRVGLNRMEISKHLSESFFFIFYNIVQPHMANTSDKKSRQESILEQFLECVQKNYKEQRSLGFYANELCLTTKHLSEVIKKASGKSANDWINEHVLLESKAFLKSTTMTVQQISHELNFPSQSFFSKYFKQHVGISPKEYRNTE
jgi:AraC-like DNA-binding protein